MAFRRPSRGAEPLVMRRDTLESRADRGMRAYVTSGLVPTRAKRQACALRPHATSCGRARWLAHPRGAKAFAHTPPSRRRSRVGLRGRRATSAFLCRHRRLRWQLRVSGGRDGPRRIDGDARRKHAHGRSRSSATLTLPDVSLHVWRGAVRCYGRVGRPDRSNETTLLGLLKVRRSRLA